MKRIVCILLFAGILGSLFFAGCKTTEEASLYTLTVTTTAGVTGTPAAGTYTYSENDTVSYSYSGDTGYKGVTVTLDGAPIASSGSITISGNHTLAANADPIDIRGKWEGQAVYQSDPSKFSISFSGQLLSGNTSGMVNKLHPLTGKGNYTVTGNQVEFTLVYGNDEGIFSCTGTFEDENHMSGTWDYEEHGVYWGSGTWELERI